MRVAVLSDIHGNIHALDAVLERLESRHIDQIIVAGDVVNLFPHSKACWQRVKALNCPILRGNHERYLYDYGTPNAPLEWLEDRFKGFAWQRSQFRQAELDEMRELPLSYVQDGVLFVHAALDGDRTLLRDADDRRLERAFPNLTARMVVRGHEHLPAYRRWRGTQIVTGGALGLPLSGTGEAFYLLLDIEADALRYERCSVPYDRTAALASIDEDFLEAVGPMGEIFRLELLTIQPQALHFFRTYGAALQTKEIGLEQAVTSYLDMNS